MKRTPLKRTQWVKKPPKATTRPKNGLKLPKPKVWSLKRADDEFSLWIRNRDGMCLFPSCTVDDIKKLQCSHYIGRAHKATRFDPENCISLCWPHHFKDKLLGFEYQKQVTYKHGYDGQYTLWMKNWLGLFDYANLMVRGKRIKKQYDAILDCMKLVGGDKI